MTDYPVIADESDISTREPVQRSRSFQLRRTLADFSRSRTFWAVGDQAVVSAANFITTILLGRFLLPETYGVYGILLEGMMYLNSLQAALIIYPLTVRGVRHEGDALQRFVGTCLLLTVCLGLPLCLVMAGVSFVLGIPSVALWLMIALFSWQVHELFRRALISRLRLREALAGDAVRYGGLALGVGLLVMLNQLSLSAVFLVMAIVSVPAILLQIRQIGVKHGKLAELPAMIRNFWSIGRWMLFTSMTALVTTIAVSWTLLLAHGEATVGAFNALANLVKISHPMMFSIMGLITPAVALAMHNKGLSRAAKISTRYALIGLMALLPFYILLLTFPKHIIALTYGRNSPYIGLANELRVFAVWYALLYCANVSTAYLNGLEFSRHGFYAQLAQMAAAALITIPLTAWFGLDGLLAGGLLSAFIMCLALVYFIHKVHRPGHLPLVSRPVDRAG